MATPTTTASLRTLRPDLQGAFPEFMDESRYGGYAALQVLPPIEANLQTGSYTRLPAEELIKKPPVCTRASDGSYTRMSYGFKDESYATVEYGLEAPVSQRNRAVYAEHIDSEMLAVRLLRRTLLINMEKAAAELLFDETSFNAAGNFADVSVEWSTAATATPIADVKTGKLAVRRKCGRMPDTLLVGAVAFENLRLCKQVIDAVQAAGAGRTSNPNEITQQLMAVALGVDRVVVAGSMENSADPGLAAVLADTWDDEYALVCVTNDSRDLNETCIGRTFHWGGDGSSINGVVEGYGEDRTRADVVRVRHEWVMKRLNINCGYLLGNITA